LPITTAGKSEQLGSIAVATINQALLYRLSKKLGVSNKRVYQRIQQISAKNRVPRHLGALLLAGENNISVQKYATSHDLAELRGIPPHVSPAAPSVADHPSRSVPQKIKAKRLSKTKENTVFVVHGRDETLRDAAYEFLGALGLKAQEWGHAIRAARGRGGNPFVNDAVTKIMDQAQAIVVLLSPDDEVKLKSQFVTRNERATEAKVRGQARPNVIFETGIAIGAHHKKTVIVQAGDVKPFTDIGGMHILRLTGTDRSRHEFANRLRDLGCTIDTDGDHWLRAGDFSPTPHRTQKKRSRGKR
jgi:predicted nucleotide-binding protein